MPNQDRRYLPRLMTSSPSRLRIPGKHYLGSVEDISLAGALFRADHAMADVVTQACCLEFLNLPAVAAVAFHGIVMRQEGTALGIRFKAVGQQQYDALIHLIDGEAGRLALLDRELSAVLQKA